MLTGAQSPDLSHADELEEVVGSARGERRELAIDRRLDRDELRAWPKIGPQLDKDGRIGRGASCHEQEPDPGMQAMHAPIIDAWPRTD